MAEFRFTPYSIEAFKRIARDVQRAYPLTLQQSQEVLAKSFGYADLHALQEHLKTNPAPGPQGQGANFAALTVNGNFMRVVHDLYGRAALVRSGRREFQDLCATWDPERRRRAMDFEDQIDRTVEADFPEEWDVQTAEYVVFDDRRRDIEERFNMPAREGLFVVTEKGDVARRAMRYIVEAAELAAERDEPEEYRRQMDKLWKLVKLMPNNPYPLSIWLSIARESVLDDEGALPEPKDRSKEYLEGVSFTWDLAKHCRSMFDELMPSNFKGTIVPNLVGVRIENEPYFQTLNVGALSALALGHERTALAWARRSLALDPSDREFARGIIDMIEGG